MTLPGRRHVLVDVGLPEIGYVHAGVLLVEATGRPGFAYHRDYRYAPIDPHGLNHIKAGRRAFPLAQGESLHPLFVDSLPGSFGMRVLVTEDPAVRNMSPGKLLWWLGTRHVDGLFYRTMADVGVESPIRGLAKLDEIRARAVGLFANEVVKAADHRLVRWALTVNGGARPKAEFEDDAGHAWVAKFNLDFDPYNMGRVEHATFSLLRDAGVLCPRTRVVALPSGNDVLLIERFDRQGGRPMHKLSAATLAGVERDKADYLDIARAIREHSAKPEPDLDQLYRSMLVDAGVNNTDNHLKNFEFVMLVEGWRFAPAFDKLPDPTNNAPVTSFCGLPAIPHLTAAVAAKLAERLGLPAEQAARSWREVSSALANVDRHLREAGVRPEERELIGATVQRRVALEADPRPAESVRQTGQRALAAGSPPTQFTI